MVTHPRKWSERPTHSTPKRQLSIKWSCPLSGVKAAHAHHKDAQLGEMTSAQYDTQGTAVKELQHKSSNRMLGPLTYATTPHTPLDGQLLYHKIIW